MAPPRWQTPPQLEFLKSYLSSYLLHLSNGKLAKFWPIVTEAWFSRWPEIDAQKALNNIPAAFSETESQNLTQNTEVLFPDIVVSPAEVLKLARKRRKGQLKHWFRNNSKDNKPSQNPLLNHLNVLSQPPPKNKRRHHRTEIYEKLYAEKISVALKSELALHSAGGGTDESGNDESDSEETILKGKKRKSEWMKTRRRLVKEMWEAETEEVRMEVEKAWEAEGEVAEKNVVESQQTIPEDLQRAIEELPEYMSSTLNHQKNLTNWVGMAVLGGPKPNANGRLDIITVHVGKTDMGNNFADSHPDFNRDIIAPFGAWLKRVFPSSVRQGSAIVTQSQNVSPSHTVDDTLTVSQFPQSPTLNQLPNLSDPGLISMKPASFAGSKSPKRKKRKNKRKASVVEGPNSAAVSPLSQAFSSTSAPLPLPKTPVQVPRPSAGTQSSLTTPVRPGPNSAAVSPLPQAFSSTSAPLPLPKTPVQVPRPSAGTQPLLTTPVRPGPSPDWSRIITPINTSSPLSSSPLKTPSDRFAQRLFLATSPSADTAYPDLDPDLQPSKEPTGVFETQSPATPGDTRQIDPWSLPTPSIPTRNGVPTAVNPAPSPTPVRPPDRPRRQPAFRRRLGLGSQSNHTSNPPDASPSLPLPPTDNMPSPPLLPLALPLPPTDNMSSPPLLPLGLPLPPTDNMPSPPLPPLDKSPSPQRPSPKAPLRKYKGWVYIPITSPQAGEGHNVPVTEPTLGRRVAKRRVAADGSELSLPTKKARTEATQSKGKGKGKGNDKGMGKGSKGKGKA